jgi:UDP-N-acetylglucosamine 2-epimerase (non-hydrolysing)
VTGELHLVAAARPNLPKLAALWHALPAAAVALRPVLLHTGQHHDPAMFAAHLAPLGLPAPEIALGIAGGSHATLTGRTMMACEATWQARLPAMVVVAGDVDGALAATLAARKLGLPVAHLEAGLRGGEPDLPEELNRRAIDAIATLLWAPDAASAEGLRAAGHAPGAVRAVGNAMIDTLRRHLPAARAAGPPAGLTPGAYGVVTLHRAGNVDPLARLSALLAALAEAAARLPLVWPLHPRTAARLTAAGFALPPGIATLPPLPGPEFLALLAGAKLVVTDSGGVQEEAWALDLPCLTLRAATERPLTVERGTSRLLEPAGLSAGVAAALAGDWPRAQPIALWDGAAGARMAAHLAEQYPR